MNTLCCQLLFISVQTCPPTLLFLYSANLTDSVSLPSRFPPRASLHMINIVMGVFYQKHEPFLNLTKEFYLRVTLLNCNWKLKAELFLPSGFLCANLFLQRSDWETVEYMIHHLLCGIQKHPNKLQVHTHTYTQPAWWIFNKPWSFDQVANLNVCLVCTQINRYITQNVTMSRNEAKISQIQTLPSCTNDFIWGIFI